MNEDKLIINARTLNLEDSDYTLPYINSANMTAAALAGIAKLLNNTLTNNTILNIIWRRDTDITTAT